HPHDDYSPIWSPDGSKLGFSSSRNIGNMDVYFIWLKRSDDEKSDEDWEVVSEPLPPLKKPGDKNGDKDKEQENEKKKSDDEKEVEVSIDFQNIHLRARRLTSLPGSEFSYDFSPDGKEMVYTSNNEGTSDILKIKCTGEDSKKLVQNADPRQIKWEKKPDLIYFLSGGDIKSVKPDGGNQETHIFSAAISIDPQAERRFKFNEIWRLENNWFYDSEFHGKDWKKIGEVHEPIALSTRHYRDFSNAVNIMLGRLNASHLYYGDSGRPPTGPNTGYLGCVFSEDEKIGLLIRDITPHSPIDEVELGIKPGARIVGINGYGVGGWGENPTANYWRVLEGTVGVEIELGVLDENATDPRWVRLVPTDYYGWNELEYQAWMERNNRKVEELSGGRLGYLHIEGMYEIALERFEQDLYTVGHDKNGVIIDVRYNSGGWTTDWLLAMLDTRRHALTQARGGGFGYPQERTPVYTFIKPIAVLCNQWSFSNAEIFSHAIQQLDRGILVGWPTAGGVISTGGTSLADGSYISLPRRGWWAVDPETLEIKFNLENHAAIPDVLVDLTPEDIAEGKDPQLEAAVKALMTEMGLENN
ncbi:MAG: S41 family peptidase, partial [bacterium]